MRNNGDERGSGVTGDLWAEAPLGGAPPARTTTLRAGIVTALLALAAGCGVESAGQEQVAASQSCMLCHNGSLGDDYGGPGLENPHPFGNGAAAELRCVACHGGNDTGVDKLTSHVPPPPQIGDREHLEHDQHAYFNRLTLAGMDKFPDYTVDGQTYSALDYLQFLNPGDLRVTEDGRGCGQCHSGHSESVAGSLLATEAGILGGAMYAIGVENAIPDNAGDYEDTAADLAFRAVSDPDFTFDANDVGAVASLIEFPVFSKHGATGPDAIHGNPLYNAADMADDFNADNSVVTGSPLANVYHEQIAFTCGDCHLGSAGANNRYGDFRSSGCSACHLPYSLDGRSRSGDPNFDPFEPFDPDDIRAPERSHIRRHVIQSVAKTLPSGEHIQGIDDYTCAGCHQGSNRTVMQYWGIRLDQNGDVAGHDQYPADPVSFTTTANDTRLFDPVVDNETFNGRRPHQYLLMEDYDGDGRDDTPADVHYDAGMGCIDCHGSYDLHGGDTSGGPSIHSRMEQEVAIRCESCHGSGAAYAATVMAEDYDGNTVELAVDAKGNPLKHVKKQGGNYYLYSRLTGAQHYISQTLDVITDTGKTHPVSGEPIYSEKASYAMGRADGDPSTGIGPQQTGGVTAGFSHMDDMDCASCHASWTNSCIGCHLGGEYDTGNNFSNITGDRIVFEQANADFVYQTPVPFQLGIGPNNRITPISPNTEMFFQYRDLNGDFTEVFAFSDRRGNGNNPAVAYPALSHNALMPHSIRGKVTATNEGPRYCVACHLTETGLDDFGAEYDAFRTAMASVPLGALDFDLLKDHIGKNPGNTLNSPLWVHMVAGLGSGLFLFDEHGCAVNPLDDEDDRTGCNGVSPADTFDLARAYFNLDRLVDPSGVSGGSSNHALLEPGVAPMRDGSLDPEMAGPLGATLVERLSDPTTGIVLDSWLDADAGLQGDADDFVDE